MTSLTDARWSVDVGLLAVRTATLEATVRVRAAIHVLTRVGALTDTLVNVVTRQLNNKPNVIKYTTRQILCMISLHCSVVIIIASFLLSNVYERKYVYVYIILYNSDLRRQCPVDSRCCMCTCWRCQRSHAGTPARMYRWRCTYHPTVNAHMLITYEFPTKSSQALKSWQL